VCRAPQGGFTVTSDGTETIALPTPTSDKVYLLCVKCKPWVPGSTFDDHQISLELVEGAQNVVTSRWEPVPGYADAAYVLIFAKVHVTTVALQPQLLEGDIDTSIASTIDFQYQSGRVSISGTGTYNGQQGAQINHNLGTYNYRVSVTTTDLIPDAIGLGDVWVVKKPNYFTVFATSYIQGLSFDWHLTTSPDTLATPTGSGAYGTAIPQGPPGPQGAQGLPGVNGATWFSGDGTPSVGTGIDGDHYFNMLTGDFSKKIAGAWVVQGNLMLSSPDGPNILSITNQSIGNGGAYEAILDLPSNRVYGVSVTASGLTGAQTMRVEFFSTGGIGTFSDSLYVANMTVSNSVDQTQAWYYRDKQSTKKMRIRLTNTGAGSLSAVGLTVVVEPF
jgi:hypothetical protein